VLASYVDLQGTAEQLASSGVVVQANSTSVATVSYLWKSHGLLSGVNVSAAGQSVLSDSSGTATLDLPNDQVSAVSVSKSLTPTEQTSANTAVNLQDAIAILKMIVGLDVNGVGKPLSPYQSLAADFDGNGTVSLTDAIGVLKHVVGLTSPTPELRMVDEGDATVAAITTHPLSPGQPPAISVNTTDASSPLHLGIVGYLSGDVDGNYTGGAGSSLPPEYFQELLQTNTGLSLSQFGVYGAT
jgi:hypothetical protein